MKRLVALLLALVLMLSLAACSGNTADNNDEKNPAQTQNKTDDNNPTEDTPDDDKPEENKTDKDEISFNEIVVVDNEECVIKITGIDPNNMWGYTLKAYFENKSADKTYMFAVESATINGVQADPYFATEVAAGKKANEGISFSSDELKENGVGDYTDIELNFCVSDSEDWEADPVAEVTAHVYPYGEDKAVKFVREAQDSDKVLVDNEYVTLIATGTETDEIWGYSVKLFLVNKTDKNLTFGVDDASVNGFMLDPFYATTVYAGNCTFSSMDWLAEDFEANSITDVEEIEFNLRVYDEDDWDAEDLVNETITFNP